MFMSKRARSALLVSSFAAGCSEAASPPPAAPRPVLTAVAAPAKTCKSGADCSKDERCDFAPGCDVPGACVPPRPCTKDLVPYCGCDGHTFESSGTCPEKAFSRRGACEGP